MESPSDPDTDPSDDDSNGTPNPNIDNDDVILDPDDPNNEDNADNTACSADAQRTCYTGPAETDGVGACSRGVQTCVDGEWGGCEGEVIPAPETPFDGVDNDCNGSVDENRVGEQSLAGGHWHSCYLRDTGSVYCWGHNEWGQIGNGSFDHVSTPTPVLSTTIFDQLTAGFMFNCALSGGDASCWGRNEYGQLGDMTTVDRNTPVTVSTPLSFSLLSAGSNHICGLTTDGHVACWGSNEFGQIADPTFGSEFHSPQPINVGVELVSLTAGQLHNCGLDAEGHAFCWGYNGHGQVGSGSEENIEKTLVLVGGERRFSQISAGYRHTCAVTQTNGEVWCWGRNPAGQLGDGTFDDSPTPVKVDLKEPVERVFTGYFHTCAVTASGVGYCWGQNVSGQLGDGTTDPQPVPVEIATDEHFVEMAMMVRSTCGRTANNDMFCWGENNYGQFATNSPGQSTTPSVTALP